MVTTPSTPQLRIRSLTIYKLRTRSLTIYKYIRNNNKLLSLHLQNSCLPHFLERPHLTLPATSGVETENHFTRRLHHMCAKKNVVQWIGVCCVLYIYICICIYVYYIYKIFIYTYACITWGPQCLLQDHRETSTEPRSPTICKQGTRKNSDACFMNRRQPGRL